MDPNQVFPREDVKLFYYVKNAITRPNIEVGDFTYYSSDDLTEFERNVTHHYDFIGDKLIIGKFCAIAKGTKFIMNGANHQINYFSTYPFNIMDKNWKYTRPAVSELPIKGDTIIGNDVWIGENSTILPGVHIGDGAIIAANSVVASNVEAYSIYGGNKAIKIRDRFSPEVKGMLLELEWWNYDIDYITDNLSIIAGENVEKLKELLKK